ncbi:MAG: hypothetical protein J7623_11415 [Chitinophaga sp.]|nr:hypothetical protein [Chitinophaga sp.]
MKATAKPAAAPKKKTATTTTTATPVVEKKETASAAPATTTTTTTTSAAESKPSPAPVKAVKPVNTKALYSTAVGLKAMWGFAVTGKHFFKDHHAGEAILKFRGYHAIGNDINLTLLYEYHGDIPVEGLRWYAGGGPMVGRFKIKNRYVDEWDGYYGKASTTYFGVSAVAGAEYKFKGIPLAVSADWQPAFQFTSGYYDNGFTAEYGGVGVKYTF